MVRSFLVRNFERTTGRLRCAGRVAFFKELRNLKMLSKERRKRSVRPDQERENSSIIVCTNEKYYDQGKIDKLYNGRQGK